MWAWDQNEYSVFLQPTFTGSSPVQVSTFVTWLLNWVLVKLLGRNRTGHPPFLLRNSSSAAVGSLLLRAEIGSETLQSQEETACSGAVGSGEGV